MQDWLWEGDMNTCKCDRCDQEGECVEIPSVSNYYNQVCQECLTELVRQENKFYGRTD